MTCPHTSPKVLGDCLWLTTVSVDPPIVVPPFSACANMMCFYSGPHFRGRGRSSMTSCWTAGFPAYGILKPPRCSLTIRPTRHSRRRRRLRQPQCLPTISSRPLRCGVAALLWLDSVLFRLNCGDAFAFLRLYRLFSVYSTFSSICRGPIRRPAMPSAWMTGNVAICTSASP